MKRAFAALKKPGWTQKQAVTAGGLRVVAVETPHLSQAYVALLVNAGSRHEAPRESGLTHFLEHMVFRGTRGFSDARALNAAAEAIGGALEAATFRDHTLFATACHPSRVADALTLLGEIVTTPRFTHLEVEREIVREEMRESLSRAGEINDIDAIAHGLLYGAHPLGQPIDGTLANLDRFAKADLRRHLRRFYTAPNAVLVLAGAVVLEAALPATRKAFAALPSRPAPRPAPAPRALPSTFFKWTRDPGSQVDLRLSFRGLAAQDPDAPALQVLARVLGDGLSSRLHAELIDRMGLAYSLSAGPELFSDVGSFDFDAAVAPDKAERVLAELFAFAEEAERRPPSARELKHVRERYEYGMDFMRDAPADLALWIGRGHLLGTEHDVARARERFLAVTPQDCRRVARRVFSEFVVCGVGEISRGAEKALARAVKKKRAG